MRSHSTRAAVEEGVVAGGGVALIRALQAINGLKGDNEDQNVGIGIALRAMTAPLRQIAANAGDEGSVVLDKVRHLKGNKGYNAATGEYGDMLEMGILDPAKVTRTALQAAASVAGLMITTEAMVADLPEDKAAGRHAGRRRHGRHGWYGRHGRNDVTGPSCNVLRSPATRGFLFLASLDPCVSARYDPRGQRFSKGAQARS